MSALPFYLTFCSTFLFINIIKVGKQTNSLLEKFLKSAGERDRRKIHTRSITSKLLKFMSAVIPGDSSYS
jgi:hypothetical protein